MEIRAARFVRLGLGSETIPPELSARRTHEREIAFSDPKLQGVPGHAATE